MESQNCNIEKFTTLLKSTRNLILTGAPGTGKTYLAKEIAEAMGCTENEIGFVQFHPSYDYTDFVEGLRPVANDECGNIGFERKDGVFKEFCGKALKNFRDSNLSVEDLKANDCFEKVYSQLLSDVENGNCDSYNTTKGEFRVTVNKKGNLQFEQNCGVLKNTKKDYLEILFKVIKDDEKLKSEIKNIKEPDLCRLVEKNIKKIKKVDYIQYRWALSKLVELHEEGVQLDTKQNLKISLKPFVFIIDEINRGEISKIFGELFYSIDPGYRGEKGRVKTQYQNLIEEGDLFSDGFYVPENVYIIGTMNDIDRSVESMDFAFRRRFAFAEIKAEDNVGMLDELNELKDLAISTMNNLNRAISEIEGLSSAYHIGASYFLKLKDYDDDWEALWNYHLEGLLREYLRGMPNADKEMRKLENAYLGNESDSDN